MRILALDLATQTGWACGAPNETPEHGTVSFKVARGESGGMLFYWFGDWLSALLDTHNPILVVYERPHLRGRAATEVLVGLQTRVQELCGCRKVDYTFAAPTTVKKSFCGSGRASKADMLAHARELFGRVDTEDEADALALWCWAVDKYGKGMV